MVFGGGAGAGLGLGCTVGWMGVARRGAQVGRQRTAGGPSTGWPRGMNDSDGDIMALAARHWQDAKHCDKLSRPVLQPGRAPLTRPDLGRYRTGAVQLMFSAPPGPGYRAGAGLARAPG